MLAQGKGAYLGEGGYQSEGVIRRIRYMQIRANLFFRLFKVALFSRKQMKSLGAEIRQRISD